MRLCLAGNWRLWLQALSAHRHRIEFMEQPLAIGMEESMADAMQQFGIAIALDESLTYANYREHIHIKLLGYHDDLTARYQTRPYGCCQ